MFMMKIKMVKRKAEVRVNFIVIQITTKLNVFKMVNKYFGLKQGLETVYILKECKQKKKV